MDSYSGSEPRNFISFHLGEENQDQPQQTLVENETAAPNTLPEAIESPRRTTIEEVHTSTEAVDQGSSQQQSSPSLSLMSRLFATDSSGSNESCGTCITCKMSQFNTCKLEEAAAKVHRGNSGSGTRKCQ